MADKTIAQAYVQIIPTTKGISGELAKVMDSEADAAGKSAGGKFSSKFSESLSKAGSKIGTAGKVAVAGLGLSIAGVATASVGAWKEVDAAMDTITVKTGASGDALADMQKRAQAIATTIPVSFQEAGDAIGEVNTRFGLTGEGLQDLSQQFVQFASLNNTDISSSVDAVQAAMAAFGVSSKDAGDMLDTLNKAGQDTGVNVIKLAGDLSANAGTLKTFGYNASDATMLLANLSKNGVDTASAMMGLKKAYAESLESGVPMSDMLSDLETRLQNSSTATKASQDAIDLFGSRAASSLIPALQDGRLSFDALGTSIGDFSGNIANTYNETLDPLDQMTVNMNLMKTAGTDLVNAAAPLITGALTGITGALQTALPVFEQFLESFSTKGQTISTTVAPMMSTAFGTIKDVVSTLQGAWSGLSDSQQQMILKMAGIGIAAAPVIAIGGKITGVIGSVVGAGSKLIGGIGGFVGKLGSLGGAASSAAAPVQSAGTSMGTLSKNAVGLVAAGAGILLASAGIALLAKSAISLAGAGPGAATAMIGLTAAVAGMAVGAAALAPALTAGAAGLVAFGAGIALIGGGIYLATTGVAKLAGQLPTITTHGNAAAGALLKIGGAMTASAAGAVALAGGFATMLIPIGGAALTLGAADLALVGLTATLAASGGAAIVLVGAMKAVAAPVKEISRNAKDAGVSLEQMVTSVKVVNAAVDGLKSEMGKIGDAIAEMFGKATPTASAAAQTMMSQTVAQINTGMTTGLAKFGQIMISGMKTLNESTTSGMMTMGLTVKTSLADTLKMFETTDIGEAWSRNLNNASVETKSRMMEISASIRSSLESIAAMFRNTKLEFSRNIQLPHFAMTGSFNAKTGATPSVRVNWYRKAYDNAYMLSGATIFGAMDGNLLGGGEGRGSELVIGTEKLAEVIRGVIDRETSPAAMAEAFRQALDDMKGGGINTVVLNVNGKELAEATLDDFTSVIQRRGIAPEVVLGG
ncbi:phage tail tape measure protein, TP901 family, core region [Lachnospiraceae bacterium NK3A20]|nr:phage tail tape measure protein, TP901 family, core region [Lachnospiraceae bacterium NK3A20]